MLLSPANRDGNLLACNVLEKKGIIIIISNIIIIIIIRSLMRYLFQEIHHLNAYGDFINCPLV